MKYFVFQEGKAVLGGRLPQQLMKSLEESSANVNMKPDMLQGALAGAKGNAEGVMDNVDKQRFGGAMRTRDMRGQGAPAAPGGGTLPQGAGKAANAGIINLYLKSTGGDKDKTRKALTDAGWTIPTGQ